MARNPFWPQYYTYAQSVISWMVRYNIRVPGPGMLTNQKYFSIIANVPKTMALSAYQGWVTSGMSRLILLISGRMPIPYAIIAIGYPCVTPSLLCRKLDIPFPFRKTIDDQWWYQLKIKRAPDGHKCLTVHSITTRLILLNTFFASTGKNPQSLVVEFLSQIYCTTWTAPSIPALSMAHG